MDKEFYSVDEFSRLLNVCAQTVRALIKKGKLRAFRSGLGERSPFRIPVSELMRYQVVGMHEINPNLEVDDEK